MARLVYSCKYWKANSSSNMLIQLENPLALTLDLQIEKMKFRTLVQKKEEVRIDNEVIQYSEKGNSTKITVNLTKGWQIR